MINLDGGTVNATSSLQNTEQSAWKTFQIAAGTNQVLAGFSVACVS